MVDHSDVVSDLEKLGIESIYHKATGEIQGKESCPTFYHHRRLEKPYHIDYVFAAQGFANNFIKLEIGRFEDWIQISDHMPMVVEFGEDIWIEGA
jgi:endonuclease/exonuclease/phosphatase family metal-dependent hydrolase